MKINVKINLFLLVEYLILSCRRRVKSAPLFLYCIFIKITMVCACAYDVIINIIGIR